MYVVCIHIGICLWILVNMNLKANYWRCRWLVLIIKLSVNLHCISPLKTNIEIIKTTTTTTLSWKLQRVWRRHFNCINQRDVWCRYCTPCMITIITLHMFILVLDLNLCLGPRKESYQYKKRLCLKWIINLIVFLSF